MHRSDPLGWSFCLAIADISGHSVGKHYYTNWKIITSSGFHSTTIPGIDFSCGNWITRSISINMVHVNLIHIHVHGCLPGTWKCGEIVLQLQRIDETHKKVLDFQQAIQVMKRHRCGKFS